MSWSRGREPPARALLAQIARFDAYPDLLSSDLPAPGAPTDGDRVDPPGARLVGASFARRLPPLAIFSEMDQARATAASFFITDPKDYRFPMMPKNGSRFTEFRRAARERMVPCTGLLPHVPYSINPADGRPGSSSMARLAYECFCARMMGIQQINVHPGSAGAEDEGRRTAIANVATTINRIHEMVPDISIVLETMSKPCSNVVGADPADFRGIISRVTDQSRVGICIDTAHVYAAGVGAWPGTDPRLPSTSSLPLPQQPLRDNFWVDRMLAEVDEKVGRQWIRAFHVNNLFNKFGSGVDEHAPLWYVDGDKPSGSLKCPVDRGVIPLSEFERLMSYAEFHSLPFILETPCIARLPDEILFLRNVSRRPNTSHQIVAEGIGETGQAQSTTDPTFGKE